MHKDQSAVYVFLGVIRVHHFEGVKAPEGKLDMFHVGHSLLGYLSGVLFKLSQVEPRPDVLIQRLGYMNTLE